MKKPVDISPKAAERLAVLVQLERMARRCAGFKEFGFFVVNETVRFMPYDRAVFWRLDGEDVRIEAVSAVPAPDEEAPFVFWMKRAIARCLKMKSPEKSRLVTAADVSGDAAQAWEDFCTPSALWVPFVSPVTRSVEGGLWLTRKAPAFDASEAGAAELAAEAYGDIFSAWKAAGKVPVFKRRLRKARLTLGAVLILAALFPVRMAAVAPAEVVPAAPRFVTAPMSGVVKSFAVGAGQPVKAGDLLFSFDDTELRARLRLADKALAAAGEEYKKAAQLSFSSPESKARLPLIRLEIEKAKDERAHFAELAERSNVRAPVDGTAIFSDASDWIGKPVSLGEKVLTLADPEKTALRISLPIADAIDVVKGADVSFFMYAVPETPVRAKVESVSFGAENVPEGFLAYRVKAAFSENGGFRIGTRGIAKIYGGRVPFLYYALRRPFAALRRWFGI